MTAKSKKTEEVLTTEALTEGFDKQQLVESKKYSAQQDILRVLLKEDKTYSFDEVDKEVKAFLEGKVK